MRGLFLIFDIAPMFKKILLCTHGSEGARRAENYLFNIMWPSFPEAEVTVLTVVDKDWAIMSSDDWLNTSTARNQFTDYVDEQLGREIHEDWERIKKEYPAAEKAKFVKVVGGIEDTIAEVARRAESDIVLCGPYCKKAKRIFSVKMTPGLADSIRKEILHPLLPCPVLTVP